MKQLMSTVGYRKSDCYLLFRWWCSRLSLLIIPCLVLRCPALNAPPNGRLHDYSCGNIYGSVCRIECNTGFILIGSNVRICNKRNDNEMYWTGSTTRCESKRFIIIMLEKKFLLRMEWPGYKTCIPLYTSLTNRLFARV